MATRNAIAEIEKANREFEKRIKARKVPKTESFLMYVSRIRKIINAHKGNAVERRMVRKAAIYFA